MNLKPIFSFVLFAVFVCMTTLHAQRSTLIVDYGHDWGVGFYRDVPASRISDVDVDGDGSTEDDLARAWNYSDSIPLSPGENTYDHELPSGRFYGGVYAAIANRSGSKTSSAPSEGHINQNHEFRDDWNLMALPSTARQPELESYEAAGLWYWKKEDFLNGGDAATVSFASADDYIAVFISRYWGGVNWGRWVIKNGAQFYISEPTFGNITEIVNFTRDPDTKAILTEAGGGGGSNPVYKTAQTINPTTVRWAPYDPTRPAPRKMFFDWRDNPDYKLRTFDDVQAVGFLVQRDLAVGAQVSAALRLKEPIAVKWNAVQVKASVTSSTASANLNLVPIGGTSQNPQLWASATEVTYADWLKVFRWADTNQRPRNYTDGIDRHIPPYSFERDGAMGSSETVLAAEHSSLEPVTTISWYDAVVWCNALSEMEGLEPAYYEDETFTIPLRQVFKRHLLEEWDVRSRVYWKASANGYRLPTEGEWLALAGNATADVANAWIAANSNSKTNPVASRSPNSLGLYDMVGNVAEYIWDSPESVYRPSEHTSHKLMGASFRYPEDENAGSIIPFGHRPWEGDYAVGFRPVRNGTGGLASGTGTFPERTITDTLVVSAATPMSDEALRILVRDKVPFVEVPNVGSLAPGSTHVSLQSTSLYDLDVGSVEIPYSLWIRVKQWAERNHGYRFNFSGDIGSARQNVPLTRTPDEPVTQVSWIDAVIWCNALSELMQLEPVYYNSAGEVERVATLFRLSAYPTYGYPNLGQYSLNMRAVVDTALVGYENRGGTASITRVLPNPIKTGYRLPTSTESRAFGLTVHSFTDSANKTTPEYGWFKNDASFAGDESLAKAMPVGTKLPNANGLYDILGNVQEWTYGGGGLFGQYRYGNDFGWISTTYPHTMNRNDHFTTARPYLGFRVVKVKD